MADAPVGTVERRMQAVRAAHDLRELLRMEPRLFAEEEQQINETLNLLDGYGLTGL